jgi:hypothetical protein
LLIKYGSKVNQHNSSGATPLHMAAIYNYPEATELLLSHGADIMALDNTKATPLHEACRWLNRACIETLIRHHAFVNAQDQNGKTPLDYALAKHDWLYRGRFEEQFCIERDNETLVSIIPILQKAKAETGNELTRKSIGHR